MAFVDLFAKRTSAAQDLSPHLAWHQARSKDFASGREGLPLDPYWFRLEGAAQSSQASWVQARACSAFRAGIGGVPIPVQRRRRLTPLHRAQHHYSRAARQLTSSSENPTNTGFNSRSPHAIEGSRLGADRGSTLRAAGHSLGPSLFGPRRTAPKTRGKLAAQISPGRTSTQATSDRESNLINHEIS